MGELLFELVSKLRRYNPDGSISITVDVWSFENKPKNIKFVFSVYLNGETKQFTDTKELVDYVDSFKPLTYTALLKKGGM